MRRINIIENWINTKVNRWKIVGYSHTTSKGEQFWMCQCDCGFVKACRATQVINGTSKGCASCRGQCLKKPGITHSFMASYRASAARRHIYYDITIDDVELLLEEQGGACSLSGVELTTPEDSRDRDFTLSIDRIDSAGGYTFQNIQLVTKQVNMMKGSISNDEFIEICEEVAGKGGSCGV